MFAIKEIIEPAEKAVICETILRSLSNWFGVEASIVEYIESTRQMPFFAATVDGNTVGFTALKVHNPYTAEICVIGVMKEYHQMGLGKALILRCEEFCNAQRIEFLTAKTLDESRASKSYEKTRQFYLAMGFRPLEVFRTLWDENNPCLFMAKYLEGNEKRI